MGQPDEAPRELPRGPVFAGPEPVRVPAPTATTSPTTQPAESAPLAPPTIAVDLAAVATRGLDPSGPPVERAAPRTTNQALARLAEGQALLTASPPNPTAAAAIVREVQAWVQGLAADKNVSRRLAGRPFARTSVDTAVGKALGGLQALRSALGGPYYPRLGRRFQIEVGYLSQIDGLLRLLNAETDVDASPVASVDRGARTTLAASAGIAAAPLAIASGAAAVEGLGSAILTLAPGLAALVSTRPQLVNAVTEAIANVTLTAATSNNPREALTDPAFLITTAASVVNGHINSRTANEIASRALSSQLSGPIEQTPRPAAPRPPFIQPASPTSRPPPPPRLPSPTPALSTSKPQSAPPTLRPSPDTRPYPTRTGGEPLAQLDPSNLNPGVLRLTDQRQGNNISTSITTASGSTGVVEAEYDAATRNVRLSYVEFDRDLPRNVRGDGPVTTPDTELSTYTYLNLRAIKAVDPSFRPGTLRGATIPEILHLRTVLEVQKGVPLAQTRLGVLATDVISQAGGRITDARISHDGTVAPFREVVEEWNSMGSPYSPEYVAELLTEFGITLDTPVRFNFNIHFDVASSGPAPFETPAGAAPSPAFPVPASLRVTRPPPTGYDPQQLDRNAVAQSRATVPRYVPPSASAATAANVTTPSALGVTGKAPAKVQNSLALGKTDAGPARPAGIRVPTPTTPADQARLVHGWVDRLYSRYQTELTTRVHVPFDPVAELDAAGVPRDVRQRILESFLARVSRQADARHAASGLDTDNKQLLASAEELGKTLAQDPQLRDLWAPAVARYPNWPEVEAYFKLRSVPEATQKQVRTALINLDGESLSYPGLPKPGLDPPLQRLIEAMFSTARGGPVPVGVF